MCTLEIINTLNNIILLGLFSLVLAVDGSLGCPTIIQVISTLSKLLTLHENLAFPDALMLTFLGCCIIIGLVAADQK